LKSEKPFPLFIDFDVKYSVPEDTLKNSIARRNKQKGSAISELHFAD